MCVSESVSRSVRVRGSCADWLPLVRDCLSGRGFRNIAEDAGRRCLSAERGGPGALEGVCVRLSPAPSCGETDVVVAATASLGAGIGEGRENQW